MQIHNLKTKIDQLSGQINALESTKHIASKKVATLKTEFEFIDRAGVVIGEALSLAQTSFIERVNPLVTELLRIITKDDMEFRITIDNKPKFHIINNGLIHSPKDDEGGGVKNIIGIALRIIFWLASNPRPRPTFILDEPFTHMDIGNLDNISYILKMLSDKFGLQFIIVTQLPLVGDKNFHIVKKDGKSEIES